MSDFENSHNPHAENRNSIQAWENIAKLRCKSSENILLYGKELMKLGIRVNDALHIACAAESQCEYFITTDTGLLNKKVEGVRIINPIDFIRMQEEYHED
jgi:predicted nucleic acid-binding protein